MEYISELIAQIEITFGKSIRTKKDCLLLREDILLKTKEPISESTIRRFFKLIPSTKTSITTLDIFSNYIGHSGFKEFEAYCNERFASFINSHHFFYSIISELEQKEFLSLMDIKLLSYHIKHLIQYEPIQNSIPFFDSSTVYKLIQQNINAQDYFAQIIGSTITQLEAVGAIFPLLSTKYFKSLVLFRFIDIGNDKLEILFREALKLTKNIEEKNLYYSILSLNNAYKNDIAGVSYYFKLIQVDFHLESPEYQGRISLLEWLIDSNFDKLIDAGKKWCKQIHLFSIDIVQYLLLNDKMALIDLWITTFPDIKDSKRWISSDLNTLYQIAIESSKQRKASIAEISISNIPIAKSKLNTIYNRIVSKLTTK